AGLPEKNIRPKSVELVALLQSGELDYIYCYRSIAEQNKLPFLHLPAEIDFSDAGKIDYYAAASTEVAGKKPGERLRIKGMPIQYGLTIPKRLRTGTQQRSSWNSCSRRRGRRSCSRST